MTERERWPRDLPELSDDVPPSGDLTPGQEATRAAAPGIGDSGPVPLDEARRAAEEVDAGSPQDYGPANDDVVRGDDLERGDDLKPPGADR